MSLPSNSRRLLTTLTSTKQHTALPLVCSTCRLPRRSLSSARVLAVQSGQNEVSQSDSNGEINRLTDQLLGAHLEHADPEIYQILQREKRRQKHFINLIPSENFTSQAVLDALGSVMQSQPLFTPSLTAR